MRVSQYNNSIKFKDIILHSPSKMSNLQVCRKTAQFSRSRIINASTSSNILVNVYRNKTQRYKIKETISRKKLIRTQLSVQSILDHREQKKFPNDRRASV